jgi:hypothetical protein
MALYEIHIGKTPNISIHVYKEKNTAKAAYEYALELGAEIFGSPPDHVEVVEPKPA